MTAVFCARVHSLVRRLVWKLGWRLAAFVSGGRTRVFVPWRLNSCHPFIGVRQLVLVYFKFCTVVKEGFQMLLVSSAGKKAELQRPPKSGKTSTTCSPASCPTCCEVCAAWRHLHFAQLRRVPVIAITKNKWFLPLASFSLNSKIYAFLNTRFLPPQKELNSSFSFLLNFTFVTL